MVQLLFSISEGLCARVLISTDTSVRWRPLKWKSIHSKTTLLSHVTGRTKNERQKQDGPLLAPRKHHKTL